MNTSQLDQQLDRFNQERRELISKIEQLTGDLTRKEKVVTNLENKAETLTNQLAQKDKYYVEIKREQQQMSNDNNDKLEQLRVKHQEALDELTSRKIEYERDKALKE